MAQRQFRSDDTSTWLDRYGYATAGRQTISTNITDNSAFATASGTASSTTLTANNTSFANGMLVVIIQAQGTGSTSNPDWEFNKVASGGGTTALTMAYPLTINYTTGAFIYQMQEYATLTIQGGSTLSAQGWGGSIGGFYGAFATTSITCPGDINVATLGFRGGAGQGNNNNGAQGESSSGGGGISASPNGNGAGGGGGANSSGGGGSLGTAGTAGASVGAAGGSAGNADANASANQQLQILSMGGAGASGANHTGSGTSGRGGNSGGIILLVAPIITFTGTCTSNGANGTNGAGGDGATDTNGGAGSGGSILLKGQIITVETSVQAVGGTGGGSSNFGGNGGNGRIHIDYLVAPSGSTNPTASTRFDPVLQNNSPIMALF